MTLYSFFRFRASELMDTFDRQYADDLDALDAARDLCTDHAIEVYDEERFVARVKKADEPLNVRDGALGNTALQVVEDAHNRVNTAGVETQERVSQSQLSIAQDWEVRSSSMEAVRRSKDTLKKLDSQARSPWDPRPRASAK